MSLISDGELYDYLVSYDAGATSYPSARRAVNQMLRDAIRNIDSLCSVQLMSDEYVFYTTNTTYTSTANVENSAIFQRARQAEQPFWTSTYDFTREYGHTALENPELPVTNRNLISYVGPFNAYLFRDSTLKMWPADVEKPVVFVNLSEDRLRDILVRTLPAFDGACFVVDANGVCIAHTDPSQLYAQMDAQAWSAVQDGGERGAMTINLSGTPSLISYTRLSSGWTLVSALPVNEVYAEIYSVIWHTLTGMLLALLLLGALLALLVSRLLSRPIRQLTQAINIVARGNFMVNLSTTGDEFDAVQRRLQQHDPPHRAADSRKLRGQAARARERAARAEVSDQATLPLQRAGDHPLAGAQGRRHGGGADGAEPVQRAALRAARRPEPRHRARRGQQRDGLLRAHARRLRRQRSRWRWTSSPPCSTPPCAR